MDIENTIPDHTASHLFRKFYKCEHISNITINHVTQYRSGRFQNEDYWKIWKQYGSFFAFIEGFFHVMNGDNMLYKIPPEERNIFFTSESLIKNFKSPEDLSKYLRKYGILRMVNIHAENIFTAARRINDEFSGNVPADFTKLITFKGYGRKLCNMLLNLAFDIPRVAIDVRVFRASCKLKLLPQELCVTKPTKAQLLKAENILHELFCKSIFLIEMDYLLFMEGESKYLQST